MNYKIIKTKQGEVLLRRSHNSDNDTESQVIIECFIGNESYHYVEEVNFDLEASASDFIDNVSTTFAEKWIKNWI